MSSCKSESNLASFNSVIKVTPLVIVAFYWNACGHCQRIKPIFSELVRKYVNESNKGKYACIIVERTDSVSNDDILEQEGISGFPHFKVYEKGKVKKDEHGKDVEVSGASEGE